MKPNTLRFWHTAIAELYVALNLQFFKVFVMIYQGTHSTSINPTNHSFELAFTRTNQSTSSTKVV
jgi:hypothetical protein